METNDAWNKLYHVRDNILPIIHETFAAYVNDLITTASSLQNNQSLDDVDKIRKISNLSEALLTVRKDIDTLNRI